MRTFQKMLLDISNTSINKALKPSGTVDKWGQDAVGSFLGWQSAGVNNSEKLGANMWSSFISIPMLFGVGGDSSLSLIILVL